MGTDRFELYVNDPDHRVVMAYLAALGTRRGPSAEAEAEFIEAIPRYSARVRLSWAGWTALGVPDRVLRSAGVSELHVTSDSRC